MLRSNKLTDWRTQWACASGLVAVAVWTACSSTGSDLTPHDGAGAAGSADTPVGGAESPAGGANAAGTAVHVDSPTETGGARSSSSDGGAPTGGSAGGTDSVDSSASGGNNSGGEPAQADGNDSLI